jgi:tetratricopeptide (TPR) repeat protein
MTIRHIVILAALLASVMAGAATVAAQPPPSVPPPTVPGGDLLLQAETLVYSERGSTEDVESLLRDARRAFRSIPDEALRAYWDARAVLLLGSHLNHVGDSRRAAGVLPEGLDLVERALQAGDFSDGLRVLADLHSQMTLARGMFHMLRHGETARDAASRARQMDPENVRALITVAGFYLNAPRIAGGDVATGIERLEQALAMDPPDTNDRFMILGWLAEAHQSEGNLETARRYAREALRIYPRSAWIQGILDELG